MDINMKNWFLFSSKVCGWLFAVPAVIWLCVACYFWVNRIDRQFSWEKATAVVTDICEVGEGDNTYQHSCLTFTEPQTGKSVTVKNQFGSSPQPIYPVGDSVEVIFPAGQPEEAMENTFIVNYMLPVLFTIAAFMFGVVSFVSFVVARKMERKITAAP